MNTTRSNPWLILILALIGGMIWISTVDMNAQSGGMPAVISNPGTPIDSSMKHTLPYVIDVEGDNDFSLEEEGDLIVIKNSNGHVVASTDKGEENFIVEPITEQGQGTGTIWKKFSNCWWINQINVFGNPTQVEILKGDDVGGESAVWCDGQVTLVERGEFTTHNGQTIEVRADGQVLIDGVIKVTSGFSTCAALVESKSGAMHRLEQFTELSPGSRQGLLHPSILLLGKDLGWEDLNRGSGVGLYKQLADQVCPPPVPNTPTGTPTLTGTNTPDDFYLPWVQVPPENTPVPPTAVPTASPTATATTTAECPAQFGFGQNLEPTTWYTQGQDYPTQPPGVDLWLKFSPRASGYYIVTNGSFVDMQGKRFPITETYPGAGGKWPDWTFEYYSNSNPGHVEFDVYERMNGQDRWLGECDIKIDDAGPPTAQ